MKRGRVAQRLFNAKKLIVLGDPVGAGWGAGFDLPGIGCHHDVGNRRVLGLAGAVRDNGGVTCLLGKLNRGQRLGQRANLVDLDQNGVSGLAVDAALQELGVGDKQVVADKLHFVSDTLGQLVPGCPVVFGQAVLRWR